MLRNDYNTFHSGRYRWSLADVRQTTGGPNLSQMNIIGCKNMKGGIWSFKEYGSCKILVEIQSCIFSSSLCLSHGFSRKLSWNLINVFVRLLKEVLKIIKVL